MPTSSSSGAARRCWPRAQSRKDWALRKAAGGRESRRRRGHLLPLQPGSLEQALQARLHPGTPALLRPDPERRGRCVRLVRLRPGRAPVLPAQDFVTCQLTGRSVSASGEGPACIVDAARGTLGCLCRYGLAGRLDAFFHALALHAVYQNRRIPKDESCLPYLTELFSFLSGSR